MTSLRLTTLACLALAGASLLTACGGSDKDALNDDSGVLKYIPADTPYVLATAKPWDKDVHALFEPYLDTILGLYRQMLIDASSQTVDITVNGERKLKSPEEYAPLMRDIADLLTKDKLKELGILEPKTGALYGVGLAPVARLSLSKADKVEATIAGLEKKHGKKMPSATVAGQTYRYLGDEDGRFIIAIVDDQLVLTLAPTNLSEANLKALLGLDLPKQNIADSGGLAALAKEYKYIPEFLGYMDVTRLTRVFTEPQSGMNSELLGMMDFDPASLSDVCRTEMRAMADVAPRLVIGYREMSTDVFDSIAVLELRDDIAKGLMPLAAPVPGLGKDHGGVFSMGVGLDMQAFRQFVETRVTAISANPYECEQLAELNGIVPGGRKLLDTPLPPMVYGIKGFLAVIDDVGEFDIAGGQPPTDISMRLLLATDGAEGLLAMGGMFVPQIAQLDLKPDGKPVEMALPPVGLPFQTAHVAMTDAALGLAVGDNASNRISKLIGSPVGEPNTFFSSSMDMQRYYAVFGDMLEQAGQMDPDSEEMSAEQIERMSKMFNDMGELFERMSYSIRFTDRGVEIPSVITLKD